MGRRLARGRVGGEGIENQPGHQNLEAQNAACTVGTGAAGSSRSLWGAVGHNHDVSTIMMACKAPMAVPEGGNSEGRASRPCKAAEGERGDAMDVEHATHSNPSQYDGGANGNQTVGASAQAAAAALGMAAPGGLKPSLCSPYEGVRHGNGSVSSLAANLNPTPPEAGHYAGNPAPYSQVGLGSMGRRGQAGRPTLGASKRRHSGCDVPESNHHAMRFQGHHMQYQPQMMQPQNLLQPQPHSYYCKQGAPCPSSLRRDERPDNPVKSMLSSSSSSPALYHPPAGATRLAPLNRNAGAGDSGADPTEGICSDSRVELPHQRQQEGLQCSQEQHQHQALFHMQQANGAHPGPSPALRGGIDTQNTAFGNHFPVPAAAAAMDTLLSFHRASLHSHRPSSPRPGRPSAAWQMKGVSTSPAHPDPSSTKREGMQGAADMATHPTGTDKQCKQTNALRPSAPSSSSRNLWR